MTKKNMHYSWQNLLQNKRHLSYVNLIPYNPVNEHIQYERSTPEAIQSF